LFIHLEQVLQVALLSYKYPLTQDLHISALEQVLQGETQLVHEVGVAKYLPEAH
jgi:hypothetical protein